MPDRAVVYCDESGNDGPNYINPEQPFYVLAGWVVPEHSIVDASVAIAKVHQQICRNAPELKFKTFRKNESKLDALLKLLGSLGQLGLVPTFVLAEKRFCVGAKIVETFLDPFYNDRVQNGFSWDVETKQELANVFCERLPETTLAKFAQAYREPALPALEEALADVIAMAKERVNPEIANLLSGSELSLHEIAEAERTASASYEKAAGTLNFPCLVSYLMLIEELARVGVAEPVRVVHDEQGPYQAGYEQLFETLRGATPNWMVRLPGQDVPFGTLSRIKEFEIQSSVTQPLVQAADLLAGAIAFVAAKLRNEEQFTDNERELMEATLPGMLVNEPRLAWPICSDRMFKQIGKGLFPSISSTGGSARPATRLPTTPLPVFPVVGTNLARESTLPLTLPLFGFARRTDGALAIVLPPERPYELTAKDERSVFLFSTEDSAREEFAEQTQWNSTQEIVCFGPAELSDLATRLDASSAFAQWLIVDPFSEFPKRATIQDFATQLRRTVERVAKIHRLGAADELLQHHDLNGRVAITLLLSSGLYGAAWKEDSSSVFTGETRSSALDRLVQNA